MKKILKIISLVLVYAQINTCVAFAGDFFLNSSVNEKSVNVKLGYTLKFGQGTDIASIDQKLSQNTADASDYFSEQLGTIAVLFLLMLLLTVGRKDSGSGSGSSGGANEGGEFEDSKLVPTNEEIKDTEQVTDEGIADTNKEAADK